MTTVTWAEKELKAYRRSRRAGRERCTVELELPAARLHARRRRRRRVVEPGEFELLVGPSSRRAGQLTGRFRVVG